MGKKIKIAVIALVVYMLVFSVGFKSGEAYLRMKQPMKFEKIMIPPPSSAPNSYYIV